MTNNARKSAAGPGVDLLLSGDLGARASRAIGSMLRTLLTVLPVMFVATLFSSTRQESIAVGVLLLAVAGVAWLHRRARLQTTIFALLAILVVYGIAGVVSFGSIRSAAILAFVGSVIVGGIFLDRRRLAILVAANAVAIGGLIFAENSGWLVQPHFSVGLLHWIVHVAVIGAVALNVYYARSLVLDALVTSQVSKDQLARIFQGSPAALLRTSLDEGRILDVNESYARMFRFARSDLLGRTTTSFDLWHDPTQRLEFYARLERDGRVENMPVKLKRGDAEAFDALISAEVLQVGQERQLMSTVDDVSELVRTRDALRASEERFAKIFNANPAALTVTNLETRELVSANKAAERIFVDRIDDVVGTVVGYKYWDRPEDSKALRARLSAEGSVLRAPVRLRRGNGEAFEALMSLETFEDSGQQYLLSIMEDVSEERAAREALEASEQRFSSTFRFSPIGMTITRMSDGTILEVNDADRSTLGFTRDEVIGRRSTETGAWSSVADRERFIARLAEDGSVSGYEVKMRNKAGELVDVALWAAKMDLNGEPCVLTAAMNVSEKKREEAVILGIARGVSGETGEPFFRTLVEHLAQALGADIAIVGEIVPKERIRTLAIVRDGTIVPNMEYDLAGTPCSTLARQTGLTLYADGVSELFPHDAALAESGMRGYVGVALRDPDGTPIGVLNIVCRARIEKTARTEALFLIFAARAQAELLRMKRDREIGALNESLEQRVAQRTAQLEASNRELEAFSYSVSHDLRAPLRAIDGFVRILTDERGAADEALRLKARERILAGARRMNELIDDLIGLARVTQRDFNREQVDLSALVREVGQPPGERDPDRTTELRVADGLRAHCDRALMRIVLENLFSNAWKFSAPRAHAVVEFGAEVLPEGRTAYFVRDNGAGFDPEYAHRLFAPFQRLHSDKEFEGTGIGLATVRRIVALHGGRTWAAGSPGRGAAFYFTCEAE